MFTGIVEEVGRVQRLWQSADSWQLRIAAASVLADVQLGHSIAINGTCLTVTEFTPQSFTVGLSPETLRCTNLGELLTDAEVNLERSLAANGRIGGHFVQGHVDGTGVITKKQPEGDSLWLTIDPAPDLLRLIVPKGYVAIDGTSLTVVDVTSKHFTFMLVAYTQTHITLPRKPIGDRVNIEVDILGKYVKSLVEGVRHDTGNN
ncbi:riboflavin synthase subunit alpha [Anaerolineae bacterium]|nr:riboflavin synthase [Anaerolineaceae bacterium]GDX67616.1 riboflavin synthase subunit alpha [Anaerolineae bacterium]